MTADRHAQLQAAYMLVFDSFAVGRTEVAEGLGISKSSAGTILHALRDANLVDSYDVNQEAQGAFKRGEYKELCWQAFNTYDDFTRDQALAEFLEKLPAPATKKEGQVPDKKAADWKNLPKTKKLQYLLDHPTISDSTWTEEKRLPGEKRVDFLKRLLGRKAA